MTVNVSVTLRQNQPSELSWGQLDSNFAKLASGVNALGVQADASTQGLAQFEADLASSDPDKGAALVGIENGRTQADKNRERRSFLDFGGIATTSDAYNTVMAAWASALANGHDLYLPGGTTLDIGANSFPWRQQGTPTSLLDCKNISIFGDGPNSVFKTTSVNGADVFQLNGVKNLHIRNVGITATLTGSSGSGSNGISITGGFDNLTLLDIYAVDLPSLDKGTYVDGGKALSIQPGTTVNDCGTLIARIYATGCAEGFGVDADLSTMTSKKMAVNVRLVAVDCYRATKISYASATSVVNDGWCSGINVRGHAINCQEDVVLSRAHGVDIDLQVTTTKTAAARRLSPSGVAWFSSGPTVQALYAAYAKNAAISVRGYKGECDYKAQIGGNTAGASGLTGQTQRSSFYLDVGGAAATADINAVNSGGNIMADSELYVTLSTASSLPSLFYTVSYGNTLSIGPAVRFTNPSFSGTVSLKQSAAGNVETGSISQVGNITTVQGKNTSSAGAVIAGLADQAGTFRLGIRNGAGVVIDALGTTSALGTYVGKHPIYNAAGTLIGYMPIYN